jgi:hypothetical protein
MAVLENLSVRASSVLPPKAEHAAANMLSSDSSLAWYSQNLTTDANPVATKSHKIRVVVEAGVTRIDSVTITFQGGFVGTGGSLKLTYSDSTTVEAPDSGTPWGSFEDSNDAQTFALGETTETKEIKHFEMEFTGSTDFYGRIIIYSLEAAGA